MKQIRLVKILVAIAAISAVTSAVAQQSTTTTTSVNPVTGATTTTESSTVSTQGTITAYTPTSDYITFRGSETAAAPARYYYDKQTTILDPEGRTVTWSAVRPDEPATVYYVRDGDRMIVRKIILSKPGTVYEKKETTTTTTTTARP